MSDRISLSVKPVSLAIVPGETAELIATVRNSGKTVDQFSLGISGVEQEWYSLPVSSVALFPNDEDHLKINIQPPRSAAGAARTIQIKVTSQENPADSAVASVRLELLTIKEVQLSVTPQRVVGSKGVFQVMVNNPGGSEIAVNISAVNINGSPKYAFQSEKLSVPPGNTSGTELEVRPGWLGWLIETKYDFEIRVVLPGAEGYKKGSGQLVSFPWYKYLQLIKIPWLSRPPVVETFAATTQDKREFKLSWVTKRATRVTLDGDEVESKGEKIVTPSEVSNYTLSATNKNGTINKVATAQPQPIPKAKAVPRIRVSLPSDKASVYAGGAPTPFMVQIQNLGEIVDKFAVEIQGIDASWYTRSASSVALMPQASDQVQILFQPPKKKGVKAGKHPFAVVAQSQSKPEESTIVTGELEILPQAEYKLGVRPYRVSGRRKGSYFIQVNNTGVSPVSVALAATDMDEGLRFKFKTENVSVLAWQNIEVPVIARPKKGGIIGEKKRYDVLINATAEGLLPQTANGEFHHAPWIASWKPIFRLLRAAIVLAALIVLIVFVLKWGGGWSTLVKSPQQWVENLVNTFEGWFFK